MSRKARVDINLVSDDEDHVKPQNAGKKSTTTVKNQSKRTTSDDGKRKETTTGHPPADVGPVSFQTTPTLESTDEKTPQGEGGII